MTSSATEVKGIHSPSSRRKYDVHISLDDEQLKNKLICCLIHVLSLYNIKTTFCDLLLMKGKDISQTTLDAIEESKCSILLLCHKYPFSTRCLHELVKIIDCMKRKGQLVLPVFYQLGPSEVRNLEGVYGEAKEEHQEKFKNESGMVARWEVALNDAANLGGWTYKTGCGTKSIEEIVEEIAKRLYDFLAGLESHLTEPHKLLDPGSCDDVDIFRKNGIGGKGAKQNKEFLGFPNVARPKLLVTSSNQKESENGGRLIMPSACAASASKLGGKLPDPQKSRGAQYNSLATNHFCFALNDASSSAFFASSGAESTAVSAVQDALSVTMRTNERKFAMQILQIFVSKRFSELLTPEGMKHMQDSLTNVLSFSADDEISRSVVLQLLNCFTQWSQDYEEADTKLKTTTAKLSEVKEIQNDFKDVIDESKKAVSVEEQLSSQLDSMQDTKREVEERLEAVTAIITGLSSSLHKAAARKKFLLEKGTELKTKKDNLMIQLPRIKAEQESARSIQRHIEDEWYQLGELFKETLMLEFGSS